MYIIHLFFLITLSFQFWRPVFNDENNKISLTYINCKGDDTIAANFSCTLKAVKRMKSFLSFHANVLRSIDNIWVTLRIYQKNRMRYLPYLVNHTDSICGFFKGKTTNYYTKYAMNWILPYCNFEARCPIGPKDIYCKDMVFTLADIPLKIPTGNYRVFFSLHTGKLGKSIINVTVHSVIYE